MTHVTYNRQPRAFCTMHPGTWFTDAI